MKNKRDCLWSLESQSGYLTAIILLKQKLQNTFIRTIRWYNKQLAQRTNYLYTDQRYHIWQVNTPIFKYFIRYNLLLAIYYNL